MYEIIYIFVLMIVPIILLYYLIVLIIDESLCTYTIKIYNIIIL